MLRRYLSTSIHQILELLARILELILKNAKRRILSTLKRKELRKTLFNWDTSIFKLGTLTRWTEYLTNEEPLFEIKDDLNIIEQAINQSCKSIPLFLSLNKDLHPTANLIDQMNYFTKISFEEHRWLLRRQNWTNSSLLSLTWKLTKQIVMLKSISKLRLRERILNKPNIWRLNSNTKSYNDSKDKSSKKSSNVRNS